MKVPPSISDLARMFDRLPGVGPRAALRYAYWLASQSKSSVREFATAVSQLAEKITACEVCGVWTDASPCSICSDPRRNNGTLCVVAVSPDVRVLEEAGVFQGRYHVLGGLIDPIEGHTPDQLRINNLLDRMQKADPPITEVVLALDPDVLGDTTAMYLMRQLSGSSARASLPVWRVTRLARGIPTGAQIEYADEATITDAFINRRTNSTN